ncbi:MAG: DUF547 domain-containing protein [Gammaproteobacteria bacterium]|nr:DUF547 domain-containing protein [Gammaproteobacteria bacterium]
MTMRQVASAVLLMIVGCAAAVQAAAPPELIPMWNASDETNTETVDHGPWQEILDAHLQEHPSGVNRFDYAGLKANADNRKKLTSYLMGLTQRDPRALALDEQKAYWINLYNGLTVHVIVGRYPVDSIRDIKSGLLTPGPWEMELITIQGQKLTLDNIEHGILRPIWKDPRIHYAVNCASIGCPNLSPEAYRSDNLERLLENGAREYVNHPRGMSVDDGDLVVSSIYDWFKVDFGDNDEGVFAHLRQYATPENAQMLEGHDDFDDAYDWALNAPDSPP